AVWHDGAEDGDVAHVARHQRRLAALPPSLDATVTVHGGDGVEVAEVFRLAGHVALAAVAVYGHDGKLLLLALLQDAITWADAQPYDGRSARNRRRGAGLDPAADEPILFGIRRHPLAAAVRDLPGGLAQQQALCRGGGEDAAAARLADDCLVVEGGV